MAAAVLTRTVPLSDGAQLWTASTRLPGAPGMAFVHGGPGLWDNLEPVAAMVDDLVSTVRYDQRACGRSSADTDHRMSRFVADLDELRGHTGFARWLVFGHSFGATLALAYAAAHPDRVAALVLADGVGLDWPEFRAEYHRNARQRRTVDQQARLSELGSRARSAPEEVEWRTLSWLPDFADPVTAEALAREDAQAPFAIDTAGNAALNAETDAEAGRERERCAQVTAPVLVVHGEADPRPVGGALRLAEALPDAELVVLPGCGHQPWRERPDRFRAVLRSFVARQAGAGRAP